MDHVLLVCLFLVLCQSVTAFDFNPFHWFGPSKSDDIASLMNYNTSQIIQFYGYPVEEHVIATKDGFLLNAFRMPQPAGKSRGTLLLAHGILDSSDCWVINREDQALAFIAYKQGYDVWMMNSRGNKYGLNHKTLTIADDNFWTFSFDEMGQFDVPSTIEYILERTDFPTLSYVCHSQGCTQFIASIARYHSEYLNKAVEQLYMFAPVVFGYHSRSPLLEILSRYDVDQVLPMIGMREFLPNMQLFKTLLPVVCNLPYVCSSVMHFLVGYNSKNFDFDREPLYFSHFPSGTSSHNMIHWAQHFRYNQFDLFEYESTEKNMQHYGVKSPPSYDLKQLQIPAEIYLGEKDELTSPKDVDTLKSHAPNLSYHVIKDFSHIDFIWGKTCRENVYSDVIAKLNVQHPDYHELFDYYTQFSSDQSSHSGSHHVISYMIFGVFAVTLTGAVLGLFIYKKRTSGYEVLV